MKLLNVPGNTGALKYWLSSFGTLDLINEVQLEQLDRSDVLILPGGNVGGLTASLVAGVRGAMDKGCRLFAVCGSFQSLFMETDEDLHHSCLQLFSGRAIKLNHPRIGRFEIESEWFSGMPYFNQVFGVIQEYPFNDNHISISINDLTKICVAVRTEQILGVQFHPELSMGTFDKAFRKWIDVN
jgi:imidazoleglycerol phosphate synthase glutamine amidotransferase subunit HisH